MYSVKMGKFNVNNPKHRALICVTLLWCPHGDASVYVQLTNVYCVCAMTKYFPINAKVAYVHPKHEPSIYYMSSKRIDDLL